MQVTGSAATEASRGPFSHGSHVGHAKRNCAQLLPIGSDLLQNGSYWEECPCQKGLKIIVFGNAVFRFVFWVDAMSFAPVSLRAARAAVFALIFGKKFKAFSLILG